MNSAVREAGGVGRAGKTNRRKRAPSGNSKTYSNLDSKEL